MRHFLLANLLALSIFASTPLAYACTISTDMADTLPLNATDIPNKARVRIAEMVLEARNWPNVDIRGIVYAGGYVRERNPSDLAYRRAVALKAYLIQLGISEQNIWVDTRTIKYPDIDNDGRPSLNQIAVTLVPICDGGCERLCSDPRVTPTSRALRQGDVRPNPSTEQP
ncbi:hypothetical protein BLA13014_05276 [Burkholderia aenigmatica]|uniref:OmpA-like domain-containing protein n=1 Tax=Burkholderia aenigmatica TaxID=2015348 RepID=A0A6P2PR28_9BURK|nr:MULTISPECIES: hypothetical protein [Burkholderia]MDN7516379.1 hypothetical protein [Burkholderia sp. AU45251]VWC12213.1 hypothetical protein BLA13014_05276 [Burkholderia aenigmatica]HDR9484120.1 hypothetical protein [Burkholderia aenigmatica]HDR9515085.1 hypothetical protein [Burkholderia aenigmatica]HDR9592170.1 hypothetical protein [Burkholderia aenigmatica]